MNIKKIILALLLCLIHSFALDFENVKINGVEAKVRASSELTSKKYPGKYSFRQLFDNDSTTAWVEGVDGTPEGQWIEIEFLNNVEVYGIHLLNGYQKSIKSFVENSLPDNIKIIINKSDTTYYDLLFEDTELNKFKNQHGAVEEFPHVYIPVLKNVSNIIILLGEGKYNTKYSDMCISELYFDYKHNSISNYLEVKNCKENKKYLTINSKHLDEESSFTLLDSLYKSAKLTTLNKEKSEKVIKEFLKNNTVSDTKEPCINLCLNNKGTMYLKNTANKLIISQRLFRIVGTSELEGDIGHDIWIKKHLIKSNDRLELETIKLDVIPYSFH